MTPRQKAFALTWIVLSVLHGVAGLFSLHLPAWKMFAVVPRYTHELVAANGETIRLHDYVQERAYLMSSPVHVIQMGGWLAENHPELVPIAAEIVVYRPDGERGQRFTIARAADGSAQYLERSE